jgi:hypothetical protein
MRAASLAFLLHLFCVILERSEESRILLRLVDEPRILT